MWFAVESGGCKDSVPDGAFGRSAPVSAGPVAAGGWAEAVEISCGGGLLVGGTQTRAAGPALPAVLPPARRLLPLPLHFFVFRKGLRHQIFEVFNAAVMRRMR